MADFTTWLTGKAQLTNSVITEWADLILLSRNEAIQAISLVDQRKSGNANSFKFPKYAALTTDISSAQDPRAEATGQQVTDDGVTITPALYRALVTTDKLSNIVVGGKLDALLAKAIGENMVTMQNTVALTRFAAGTNIVYPAGRSAKADIVQGDIISKLQISSARAALRTAKIPYKFENRYYGVIAHPKVIQDYRDLNAVNDWADVNKYSNPQAVLSGEVGISQGCKWFEHGDMPTDTTSAPGVTLYPTIMFGFNSFGYAENMPMEPTFASNDNQGVFIHIGHYGSYEFGIVDNTAVRVLWTASSY